MRLCMLGTLNPRLAFRKTNVYPIPTYWNRTWIEYLKIRIVGNISKDNFNFSRDVMCKTFYISIKLSFLFGLGTNIDHDFRHSS